MTSLIGISHADNTFYITIHAKLISYAMFQASVSVCMNTANIHPGQCSEAMLRHFLRSVDQAVSSTLLPVLF